VFDIVSDDIVPQSVVNVLQQFTGRYRHARRGTYTTHLMFCMLLKGGRRGRSILDPKTRRKGTGLNFKADQKALNWVVFARRNASQVGGRRSLLMVVSFGGG
jgi:hypothetical protein